MENQLELEDNPSKKGKITKLMVGFLLVVVFLVGLILFWINREKKTEYVILGVPYYNIWNHRGEAAYFSGETTSAVFSVLDYWSPGLTNPMEADKFFKNERGVEKSVDMENVRRYVNKFAKDQFVVEAAVLKPEEIKKYVNSKIKTPLLAYLPISDEHPMELAYYPVVVVIGVSEVEKKITVHDFWLGNNREISFDELNKLWEKNQPEMRNNYFIVQPKNLEKSLEIINTRKADPYPTRTTLMVANEAMIKKYVLGIGAQTALKYDLASSFFSKIEELVGFQNDFIPVLKVQVLARLASIRLRAGDLAGALNYAEKAVERNYDIDKSLDNGWLGYEYARIDKINQGKSTDPYRVLGDVYKTMGENEKAIEAYKKALEIDPMLQAVIESLNGLQK